MAVPRWRTFGRHKVPVSVDLSCPHCGRQTNMQLQGLNQDEAKGITLAHGRCPACGSFSFFVMATKQSEKGAATECEGLFVHPDPSGFQEKIPGTDHLPEGVQRAYDAVVDVINAKVWRAAEVCCGRGFERVLTDLLPEHYHHGPLAQQLQALPSSVDLARPLARLAEAIQISKQTAAGADEEASEEHARAMVELLERMVEYLYILPARIEELRMKVEQQASPDPGADERLEEAYDLAPVDATDDLIAS